MAKSLQSEQEGSEHFADFLTGQRLHRNSAKPARLSTAGASEVAPMQALILLALMIGWAGIVIYASHTTRLSDCPPPSARATESMLAPCLERQDYAAAEVPGR
jgi:hypothetical protein